MANPHTVLYVNSSNTAKDNQNQRTSPKTSIHVYTRSKPSRMFRFQRVIGTSHTRNRKSPEHS